MARIICSYVLRRWGAPAAVMLLLGASPLAAQTGSIAGRVLDAQSGTPIPAAQVFIADLDLGVLSQQNGSYILLNVPQGARTVTVQRIGYREISQDVMVNPGETAVLDFRISEEALQLDAVIVTGTPGGTQRRAIGNTVTSVGVAEVTQNVAVNNFQDLLAGRTPGVQFTVMGGNVGTGSPIRIRGVGSFTLGSQPLIYVDGVRVNNSTDAGPTLGEGDEVSVLNDFNPEDIESIEIIKGPAAATLYGTEASAGVIQIITKKGAEGAPEFNVSIRQGINFMMDPAGRLGTFYTCAVNSSPGFRTFNGVQYGCDEESELTPYNMYDEANNYIREGYFPWPTENIYQNGHAQSYNVDVRGGTSSVRYFLSANYDDQEGYVWYNQDEVFRLRGNVSVVFNDQFSLDLSTGVVDGETRFASGTVGDGDVWQDMIWSNGYFLNSVNQFGTAPPGASINNARLGGFQEHLPYEVANVEATREYTRFTGSATLNFNVGEFDLGGTTARWTHRAIVGMDKGWDTNVNIFPLETGEIPDFIQAYCDQFGVNPGCAPAVWSAQYTETVNGTLNYERPITSSYSFDYATTLGVDATPSLTLNTSFGIQYYINQYDFFANAGEGFASPLSRTINQVAQAGIATTYMLEENKSLGYYVQEEIGWNDRLFLTAALRFDDNSTFGAETDPEKYPKFSGAWVISEESFWDFDFINSLRLRGAWGKAGRQPSVLAGQNFYAAVPGPGGAPALRPQSPGNPGIEPEVSTELELGFDFALLNDRFSGEFTHYWRTDDNVLAPIAVSASYGFPGSVDTNVGKIDNWGWEATLSARAYESDLVSVDLDFGASYTNNEIKDLGDFAGTTTIREGYPWPNIVAQDVVVEARFVDASTPNCTQALVDAGTPCAFVTNSYGQKIEAFCDGGVSASPNGPANPGKYGVFEGGTPVPCSAAVDRQILAGRGFAPWTFSIAPRISLLENRVQVFALAEGQYGRTGMDSAHLWGSFYNNSKIARLQNDPLWFATDYAVGRTGTGWHMGLYDADFWKLREVGLRYTIPDEWVAPIGASRASIAFSARNIWTIWRAQDNIYGHQITDPEFGDPTALSGDGNFYSQPPMSSLSVTLRATF